MVDFQHDFSLGGAEIGSTVHPHTLRFPGYEEPDLVDIQIFQRSIEKGIEKDIFIPDLRTHKGTATILDEKNANAHVKADAVVTQMKDQAIALLTADCAPILLYSPERNVIGGIHGSKAAITNGVIENTMCLLEEKLQVNPRDLRIYVGQTICQNHYEVGEGDTEGFQNINIRSGLEGKAHLDIRGEVVYRLGEAGIKGSNITSPNICTYGSSDKFSYRRKTHKIAEGQSPLHANNGNLIWFSD